MSRVVQSISVFVYNASSPEIELETREMIFVSLQV